MSDEFVWKETPISKMYLIPKHRKQGCEIPRTMWRCQGHAGLDIDGGAFCADGCPANKDGHGIARCTWPRTHDLERERALMKWLEKKKRDRIGWKQDVLRRYNREAQEASAFDDLD